MGCIFCKKPVEVEVWGDADGPQLDYQEPSPPTLIIMQDTLEVAWPHIASGHMCRLPMKSRFIDGKTEVKRLIKEVLQESAWPCLYGVGYEATKTFPEPVGMDRDGEISFKVKVILRPDQSIVFDQTVNLRVVTAYPF